MTRRTLLASFLLLSGCGGNSAPVAAPEDQARTVLDQALDAWKSGKSIADLKSASPSIIAADPAWEKGSKLSRFEVQGPGKPAGAEQLYTVKLWLADSAGKEAEQQVDFKVGTKPILTVFRSLF